MQTKKVEKLENKREYICNYNSSLRLKYKYQVIIKLKIIKYKKDIFHYLSFFINIILI